MAIGFFTIVLLGACFVYWGWTQGAPRRSSLAALGQLDAAIHSGGDPASMLDLVVLPANLRNRSAPEQFEFLTKTLNDEISAEGLKALRSRGSYGPLKQIFPAEAGTWAQRAGVNADDCVAFKMERGGVRCEVVLVKPSTLNSPPSSASAPYRILRLNNVQQMAESQRLATEKKQ